MRYFIGEEKRPLKLDYYIGEGEEGVVYRSGREAIKIYWDNWKHISHGILSLEDASAMTKMKDGQILLPRRIVYDSNFQFCGYSTRYIKGYHGDDFLLNWDKEVKVLENMSLSLLTKKMAKLYKAIYYLSTKGVLIKDTFTTPANHIFNGDFWIIDPGCYVISHESFEKILEENIFELNLFFLEQALMIEDDDIIYMLESRKKGYTICDLIKDEGKSFEKVLSFRNRFQ